MNRVGVRATSPVALAILALCSAACGYVRVEGEAMAPTLADGDRVSVTSAVEPLTRGARRGFRTGSTMCWETTGGTPRILVTGGRFAGI